MQILKESGPGKGIKINVKIYNRPGRNFCQAITALKVLPTERNENFTKWNLLFERKYLLIDYTDFNEVQFC